MTRTFRAGMCMLACTLLAAAARADMTWTFAVQVSAAINADPPRIELKWPTDPFPISGYTVYRKMLGAATWGDGMELPGHATSFTDESVELGKVYEYQIIKRSPVPYTGTGYIAVGLNAPLVDQRGRLILVVDRSIAGAVANELGRFQQDLTGDGWIVVRKDVDRDASPAAVKAVIKAEYDADKANTNAVVLFGRVPVVKSGNYNVDGHGARPLAADVFYADVDGDWTDANGDGIYDHNTLPSDVELQIGRIDFADMPGKYSPFPYPSEVDLLRRYLNKNHAFRHAVVRPPPRALIGNAVGDANGQAYAASAYRSLAPLVGHENVTTVETVMETPEDRRWMSRLAANEYLWAYGNGAGSDFTIGALGTHGIYGDLWASDFMEKKPKATFYTLFGSWFVEWQKPDAVLRAALTAPDHGLTSAWSGRPHLFFHHMAMGETIGYGMRLSQNNNGHYTNQVQRQLRGVHIALLGDPTLRAQQLAPPTEVTATASGADASISWKRSSDSVLGYHVYRANSPGGPFTRVTDSPADDVRVVDTRRNGASVYMVRAVALHLGHSGSFYHASQGAFANVEGSIAALASPPESTSALAGTKPADVVWADDDLPAGAVGYATDNDRWNWVSADPAPATGERAHQSENAAGFHFHFFAFASSPLEVQSGDTLFAHVYLDPASPPRQVMLTWLSADGWEHRAYWGENLIPEGVDGTASRHRAGELPPTGRWVRLEVPASAVGLEGQRVTGMGFNLYDGRATWDRAGKSRP